MSIVLSIFLGSLLMGLSGAMMPGPLLTVTINESLHRSVVAGPLLILGHALLELTLVIAIFLGLGTIIDLPQVKGSIGLIGGIFLLWMAYGIIKEAVNKNFALVLEGQQQEAKLNLVLAGITVSASNPYWSVWWATAGASALVLAGSQGGLGGAVSFYTGHIMADIIWYSSIGVAVAKGKKFLTPSVFRVILGICGVFLAGLAVYFLYSGLEFFDVV
jgi:threonine/homoserine/homoserine lactone efflux protein